MIYIFDIDGTLADISHRLYFIQQKPADWRGFFKACHDDLPIYEVARIAEALKKAGALIICITGRSDEIRDETDQWLRDFEIPCDQLYMRVKGDHREDNIVKAELYDRYVVPNYPIAEICGVFEDRKQVVDMYRAKGLRVFQVAEGNF